ncbi:MAG: 2-aminoethylphosphonate--pyruvate transaminase [Candidatus Hydrogenedens sp.]|nr:2-aminoethylphosphonate--pyruvate transaminase [Candidatus Hydrogenedens sp.]
MKNLPASHDKTLFTPGPLTTSHTVKEAMLRDLGSRDTEFIETVRRIRRGLLSLGEVAGLDYEAVLMQGSGTFAVESVFSSTVPPGGRVAVVVNGAYGERIVKMCQVLGIGTVALKYGEDQIPDVAEITEILGREEGLTHLAVIHCETTTGIINPVVQLGAVAKRVGLRYVVDAMSSFGAVPLNIGASHIDYLVSSANKCIEGVPGFGFVIARRAALEETEGWARSLSLNLLEQWRGLEANGQFRFTPPTHALLAFDQAMAELEREGGVEMRAARYYRNYRLLVEGMRGMGFQEYLPGELQGHIITSFRYPEDPNWSFETFYRKLGERGCVIYPGKVSNADCFRIGSIGRIFESDIRILLAAVRDTVTEMGLRL